MTDPKPLAIIAIDPGKRTGVAEWIEGEGFYSYEYEVNDFFDYFHDRIHGLQAAGFHIKLAFESFIITVNTAKNTQAAWSLELIGVIKFIAHRYHLETPVKQAPAVGKTFGTNGKLKFLGWFRSGQGWAGHANDAARHLATFAAQRGLIFTKDQLMAMADV